ncbi:hypothetical protein DCAR_0832791 [Daucus carota subsp. sativus]|uniref:Uncharacterized protein n=1 Tax=Daucus carota subsp. sativus TaxID=79200 RepID=A0A175YR02_DAUCS|nr:hypothetical protein DCAR_0832791 [Daucus carota subsp. sativus]
MKARQNNIMEQKKNTESNKDATYLGVAVHSQVRKIKQEMEKIKHPSLEQDGVKEFLLRPVLREIKRQQGRSRSPLGIAQRPISVGES